MKKKVFSKLLMVALVATVGIFSSCKDYDDDISDVRNSLQTNVTELQKDYNAKIEAANTSITKLQTLYNSLDAAYKEADSQLNTLIQTKTSQAVTEAKAYSDANLATAKSEAQKAADAAEQAAKDYAKLEAAAAQAAAIKAAADELQKAKDELQAALNAATTTIAEQGVSIGNLITATETLDVAVKAAQARADQAYALADKANTLAEQNKANLEAASADIAKLKTDLANLQGTAADKADVAKLQSDLAALQSKVNENVVDLASYKESITSINSELAKLTSDLAKVNTNLTESIAAVKATADANVASIDAIKSQLATIDAAWQLADENINKTILALAATVDANQTEAANNLKAAVDAITAELAAKQTLIENNDAAIRTLIDTKVSELSKLINDNAETIKANAKAIADNKTAQDAANVLMNNAIAQNAKDIAEKSAAQNEKNSSFEKAIEALKKALGDDTAETLKAYAKSIAESNALQAKLDAQGYADAQDAAQSLTLLAAIADQAEQDQKAWTAAINTAVDNLVKTYQLNSLAELIKAAADNAQTTAEANAAAKAQEIANKALADAQSYAKDLNDLLAKDLEAAAKNLKDNYTTTVDMTAAIETARAAAINQAYLKVLNALLRDYPEWYDLTEEKKLSEDVLPVTILQLAQKAAAEYIEKYGLTKDNAQALIDATIEAGLQPTKYLGTDAEGNELYSTPGVIMKEIELAAAACDKNMMDKFGELDVRLQPIEEFLGETLGEGDAFIASVNAIIAASTTAADVETLKKQIAGTEDSGLLTLINGLDAQAKQTAADIQAISNAIKNINDKFSTDPKLDPKAADSSVDASALTAFAENIQDLINRVNKNSKLVDNLENEVMKAFNKNLGKQIQCMITSINLFANQHMAQADEQGHIGYWNGEKWEYPTGYDDFDHELTFVYTIERGIYKNLAGEVKTANWNYPTELINQLKDIKSDRDALAADYDYVYGGKVFNYAKGEYEEVANGFDFQDGRYRSYEDKILVRVSPTNADLAQAEIALLNSKGEDLISAGLIEVIDVYPYESDKYITRFYPYNQNGTRAEEATKMATGLWVIEFKMKDENVGPLYAKFAQQDGNDILYAVAVKNTDFSTDEEPTSGQDRYVTSEYDLSLATEEAKHVYDFDVNDVNITKIHNRYITPDESENGSTNFTDDPKTPKYKNGFRYELTWHPLCDSDVPAEEIDEDAEAAKLKTPWWAYCWDCCFDDYGTHDDECYDENDKFVGKQEIGYTTIFFEGSKDNYDETDFCGVNTCDRHAHEIGNVAQIESVRADKGIDNRHKQPKLPIEFKEEDAPEGETGAWAKIEIEFPSQNKCGERTPIRGFFVTLDQHFAVESNNSEINAWVTYDYKNVSKYNYNHGVKQVGDLLKEDKIILQKGNKGVIYIKDEHNVKNGDVIGFRVHAVNLDGTITDPDGRAFYVEIGKKETNHKLTFSITPEKYEEAAWAVQNLTVNGEETLDFSKVDNKNGKNPITTFNDKMFTEKLTTTFFNRPLYGELTEGDEDNYEIQYTWREGNPAIRGAAAGSTNAYWPVAGTGAGVESEALGTGTFIKYANGTVKQDARYDVENFFSFQFSTLADAVAQLKDEDGKDQDWKGWNELSKNGYKAPSAETQSVRASINAQMADRLVDGATYKVTMTILRKATRFTAAQVVNSVDIDIKKVMPTALPSAFKMKSGQQNTIKDGVWTIYTRPMLEAETDAISQAALANVPLDEPTNNGRFEDAAKAWQIGWSNFLDENDPAKGEFDTDRLYDAENKTWTPVAASHHRGRWAADARPWTIDEQFEGIIIENEDGSVKSVDKNYYFVFEGAGDIVAASKLLDEKGNAIEAPKDNSKSIEAIADALYANANGITLYNTTTVPVNPGTTASQQAEHEAGYRVAPAFYKHVGDNKTYAVKAGYVYKQISAELDKTGKAFKEPAAKAEIPAEVIAKAGGSLTIDNYLNQDIIIAPDQVKTYDGKDLKTKYLCSIEKAFGVQTSAKQTAAAPECTLKDGVQQIPYVKGGAIDIFSNFNTLKVKDLDEKFYVRNGKKCAYFDAQLDDITDATTMAQLINDLKYYWIDYSSLKANGVTGGAYELKQYYTWHFAATNAQDSEAIDPADSEKNKDIKYLVLVPKYRENALPHLSVDYTGITVSFKMYHKWYNHGAKTVTVTGATILKPENQPYASRQAE